MADSECTPARTDFTSTLFIIQGLGFGEDLAAPGRVASVCRDRHDDRSPGPPVRHPRFDPSRFSRRRSTIDKPPGPGSPTLGLRRTNHKSPIQSTPPALTFPPSLLFLSSYEGLISKYGQVDKLGSFVFADGDRFEGHFKRGAMHGYGVYRWSHTGDVYFGEWRNNAQHGCGVKFSGQDDGADFGEWKDDQFLGSYTGVCGEMESYDAMNMAINTAQSARMFKYKPESEATLQRRGFLMHQDPLIYEQGTEWSMPGWKGEMHDAPSKEDLEQQHPRLYSQMQRHNEIWERTWRYYNMDLKDAREYFAAQEVERAAAAAEQALEFVETMNDDVVDDYDEYADLYDDDDKPKKKSKKGKKGSKGSNKTASLTLSLRNAGAAVERAFEGVRGAAMRRPEIRAFAERRQMKAAERAAHRGPATPFASLSLSLPFSRK